MTLKHALLIAVMIVSWLSLSDTAFARSSGFSITQTDVSAVGISANFAKQRDSNYIFLRGDGRVSTVSSSRGISLGLDFALGRGVQNVPARPKQSFTDRWRSEISGWIGKSHMIANGKASAFHRYLIGGGFPGGQTGLSFGADHLFLPSWRFFLGYEVGFNWKNIWVGSYLIAGMYGGSAHPFSLLAGASVLGIEVVISLVDYFGIVAEFHAGNSVVQFETGFQVDMKNHQIRALVRPLINDWVTQNIIAVPIGLEYSYGFYWN